MEPVSRVPLVQGREGPGDDPPLHVQARMRHAFVETACSDVERLHTALRTGDRLQVCELIHSFKGALFMLGETNIASRCLEMEMRLSRHGIFELSKELQSLEASLCTVIARYRATPVP